MGVMNLSRRGFLGGLLASAAIAPLARALPHQGWTPKIFSGAIGEYRGVIIRETLSIEDINRVIRAVRHQHIPGFDDVYYLPVHTSIMRDLS